MTKRMTYADNLRKWRVGCFNIDATRVGGSDVAGLYIPPCKQKGEFEAGQFRNEKICQSTTDDYLKGRFPANLILSHTSDCEYLGVEEDTRSGGERTTTCHSGKEPKSGGEGTGGTMKETSSVSKYNCSPDCPCRLMDEQSGQVASKFFLQIESEPNE